MIQKLDVNLTETLALILDLQVLPLVVWLLALIAMGILESVRKTANMTLKVFPYFLSLPLTQYLGVLVFAYKCFENMPTFS
jgi:hypothetical protein